jgi:PDDEXK-like domain of unknown function (DUF3799)
LTATLTAAEPIVITEPGVYQLTDAEYHADPVEGGSLSSTGARRLLDCPAKFEYERANGRPPKKEFDHGHAAHKLVLGDGPEIVVVDADSWRTAAAKKTRDEVYDAGHVPLLPQDFEIVTAMADKIREHPTASMLLSGGKAEQSLIWQHRPTGVMRRARLDYLRDTVPGQRLLISDYKTTTNAHPNAVRRSIPQWGYHIQAPWYIDGVVELGLAPWGAVMMLIMQEKTAPYVVSIVEIAASSLTWGERDCERALHLYRQYTESGHWPGYTETGLPEYEPFLCELPRYVEQEYEIAQMRGDYDLPRGN